MGVRDLLFRTEPEQTAVVRNEWLRQDLGLTPAEARFTREILKGDGLQAAADRLGISVTRHGRISPTCSARPAHIVRPSSST
jgi:hypothetical protein